MRKSLKTRTCVAKIECHHSALSPPFDIVPADQANSINSTTASWSTVTRNSRPRGAGNSSTNRRRGAGNSSTNRRRGAGNSSNRRGGQRSRTRTPQLAAPDLVSPVPGFVAGIVKKVADDGSYAFIIVKDVDGDVYCKLTQRVHGEAGPVNRGDIVWGQVVNIRGKNQFHSMVSNFLMHHRYAATVLRTMRFKDISQLQKLEDAMEQVAQNINANPRQLTKLLKRHINSWKSLFGCPSLRFAGSIQVPAISESTMVSYFVQCLNLEVPDKDGLNQTATQFKRFGLDISPFTKEKLATMSKADQKRYRRSRISKADISPLMDNSDFKETVLAWIEARELVARIYSVCQTVDVMVASKGSQYSVPTPFRSIVNMCAVHNDKSPVEVIRRLVAGPLTCSFRYPMPIKVQMGTVGEFVLGVMSRLSSETRVAVQPVFQEEMKQMLLSLRCQSSFVSGDELTVGYEKCFAALKFLGMNSMSSGQDDLRSTTDVKQFIRSFVAQLSITSHKSDKLEMSFFGKLVRPFRLGSRTNSPEVHKARASERILGFIRMLRTRKVFQMHLRSVARPLEHMAYILRTVREAESKPVKVIKKTSVHKNRNGFGGQGSAFQVTWQTPSSSKILSKQLEFICSTHWRKEFLKWRTGYGASVSEMRERHRNRIAGEDTGDFIGVWPDVPDLREFLFSKPAPVEKVSKPVETPRGAMVMTAFMRRELQTAKIKGARIAAQQKAKRKQLQIEDLMVDCDLSQEDAKFYNEHMALVDTMHGSTLEEKIDEAMRYLQKDEDWSDCDSYDSDYSDDEF